MNQATSTYQFTHTIHGFLNGTRTTLKVKLIEMLKTPEECDTAEGPVWHDCIIEFRGVRVRAASSKLEPII
jgi:hypothetical protein